MVNNIYANARAITSENGLLGIERLNRMAECTSLAEAFKILSEVNFGEGKASGENGFEELISSERESFFEFVKEVSPDITFTKYLLLPNDYHNAEVLIRSKYLKSDYKPMITSSGFITVEAMKDMIFSDDYSSFSSDLSEALLTVDLMFVSGKADGKSVDLVFKKALYSDLSKCVKKNKFLSDILKRKIDIINISVALRTRNYKLAEESFIENGTFTLGDIKVFTEETPDVIRTLYKTHRESELIESALDDFSKKRPLTSFEQMADGFILAKLKENKFDVSGYVPFIRYCFYKLAELSNVRIILSCVENEMSPSDIKSRLRETYEG